MAKSGEKWPKMTTWVKPPQAVKTGDKTEVVANVNAAQKWS